MSPFFNSQFPDYLQPTWSPAPLSRYPLPPKPPSCSHLRWIKASEAPCAPSAEPPRSMCAPPPTAVSLPSSFNHRLVDRPHCKVRKRPAALSLLDDRLPSASQPDFCATMSGVRATSSPLPPRCLLPSQLPYCSRRSERSSQAQRSPAPAAPRHHRNDTSCTRNRHSDLDIERKVYTRRAALRLQPRARPVCHHLCHHSGRCPSLARILYPELLRFLATFGGHKARKLKSGEIQALCAAADGGADRRFQRISAHVHRPFR